MKYYRVLLTLKDYGEFGEAHGVLWGNDEKKVIRVLNQWGILGSNLNDLLCAQNLELMEKAYQAYSKRQAEIFREVFESYNGVEVEIEPLDSDSENEFRSCYCADCWLSIDVPDDVADYLLWVQVEYFVTADNLHIEAVHDPDCLWGKPGKSGQSKTRAKLQRQRKKTRRMLFEMTEG